MVNQRPLFQIKKKTHTHTLSLSLSFSLSCPACHMASPDYFSFFFIIFFLSFSFLSSIAHDTSVSSLSRCRRKTWASTAIPARRWTSPPRAAAVNAPPFVLLPITRRHRFVPKSHHPFVFSSERGHVWNPHSKSIHFTPVKVAMLFRATTTFLSNTELSRWIDPRSMIIFRPFRFKI